MFVRSDYNRTTTVRYSSSGETDRRSTITRPGRQKISQIGPTATISWPLGGRSSLTFEGWFVVQRITQTLYGVLPEEQADNIVSAANKGVRTVIPNLSLTSVWRF